MTGLDALWHVYAALALLVLLVGALAWLARARAAMRVQAAIDAALTPPTDARAWRVETRHEGAWVEWSVFEDRAAAETQWWLLLDLGYTPRIGAAA